jgi:hypothetical protein
VKKGLELGGFALCDIDNPFHWEGIQTPDKATLEAKGQTLLTYYADLWVEQADKFLEFSAYGVVDAYFSKYPFVETICTKTKLHLISRFRSDASLRYLYQGERTDKAGRPQEYAGKIDPKKPDKQYFDIVYEDEKIRIFSVVVYAVALKRKKALFSF